ncbi:DUF2911 domain-containing protein [Neolewinella lacunae]|uniref:DUF2911 domain-containing protein n=1 Tax=Neolewinella lacunae TaxID=1517758 RepID=A0A923PN86_9BACT|nr:DUF2911 domain-containing protein [Neolewinella lacunae]MBC6994414.1 DUF2911 domain-containing protein [Neolewinella lacunae]MDN3633345.1 DUF2911 domain-containing protein [Neolewinella lacunae]
MPRLLLFLLAFVATLSLSAQDFADLDASPLDAVYYPNRAAFRAFAKTDADAAALQPKIRVLYSRPYMKGRKVWGGELAPFGEPYRLGANETSEIQFFAPVKIGDQVVPAGRYTFGAIPQAESWQVFFSLDLDGWGVYAYKPERNVASITVPTTATEETVENFSITLYEASPGVVHLKMGWDKTVVEVPITLL